MHNLKEKKKFTQDASWGFTLISGLGQSITVLLQPVDTTEPKCVSAGTTKNLVKVW